MPVTPSQPCRAARGRKESSDTLAMRHPPSSSSDSSRASSESEDDSLPPEARHRKAPSGDADSRQSSVQAPLRSELPPTEPPVRIPQVFRQSAGPARYTLLPIRHPRLWSLYKQHQASFWTVEELDLATDVRDWAALSEGERSFLSYVLAFFASSDGIVLENLLTRFCGDVELPEARCFYAFQGAMENVHSETYALLIETLVSEPKQRDFLFRAIETIPCVNKKAQWALNWCASSNSFTRRLVAFACVEGIFFSGSFCAVFWVKKRGILPGLCFSNELISRDEGLHCEFACALYEMLDDNERLEEDIVHGIIKDAVECEKEFICEALSVDLIGMNAGKMADYIEFVADRLAMSLGYEPLFNAENPFEWMHLISMEGKSNMFERRIGEYQLSGFGEKSAEGHRQFRLDAEF